MLEFLIVAVFVYIGLKKTAFDTKCVNMLTINLSIVLPIRNSKDLLAICVKPKAKEQFRTAVILSGTLAKFQKATTAVVVSVCTHGTTRLPLDGSS